MSRSTGNAIFAISYVACYLGSMWLVTGSLFNMMMISSTPLILGAETIVFAMIYASAYYDGHEEEAGLEVQAKAHAKH